MIHNMVDNNDDDNVRSNNNNLSASKPPREEDPSFPDQHQGLDVDSEVHRRMALQGVESDAAKAWPKLPPAWRMDKEFILTALKKSPTLPGKSDFERQFTQALRFDRQVVLAFCQRNDFDRLYYERQMFVPGCLTNDKEVMMAYCRKIPRSLQECSEELCDDREVVETALHLDGLELQYASVRLQEDRELVILACQKDGRALEFCPPGPVRETLTQDRDFMLSVLRQHGGPMLRLVSPPLQRDRELLLEALSHGMRLRFCPFEFQTDPTFLTEAIQRKSELYLELNRTVQSDPHIAETAIMAEHSPPEVHKRALELVPSLEKVRSVAMVLAERTELAFLQNFINHRVPRHFLDDIPFMLSVLRRDTELFVFCSPRLHQHPAIILQAIDSESAVTRIKELPAAFLERHPQIIVKAISVCKRRSLNLLRPLILEPLWRYRPVVQAWIKRGCRVLESFQHLLAMDEELALDVAEYSWYEFAKVGESLRGNRNFMIRALDRNGRVFRYASLALRRDLSLLVRAVASHPDAWSAGNSSMSKQELTDYIEEKMLMHRTFCHEFLCGIGISKPHVPPARRSHLPLLDRGVETSQAFKQLIAAFVGVPVGEELRLLRLASENLSKQQQHPLLNTNSLTAEDDHAADVDEEVMPAAGAMIRAQVDLIRRRRADLIRRPRMHPMRRLAAERAAPPPLDAGFMLEDFEWDWDMMMMEPPVPLMEDMNGDDLLEIFPDPAALLDQI